MSYMVLYTTEQAFQILKDYGITHSRQQVTKWIREGKLQAIPYERNKPQTGYRIERDVLERFIRDRVVTREELYLRIDELEVRNEELQRQLDELQKPKQRGRPRKNKTE